jgi:hypothetical protein
MFVTREGVVATPLRISACRGYKNEIQTVTFMFLGFHQLNGSILDAVRPNRKSEIQDGGLKPAIVISQLVDETGTKFHRLHPCFRVQQLIDSSLNTVQHKPGVETSRWRLEVGFPTSALVRQHSDCFQTVGFPTSVFVAPHSNYLH